MYAPKSDPYGMPFGYLPQVHCSISHLTRSRRLILFPVFACLVYLGFKQTFAQNLLQQSGWAISTTGHHPIEIVVAEANDRFSSMVKNQSKTLEEATAEYKRRYNRAPPFGFYHWYNMAVDSKATIIDDYDTIMASLEPFWSMSAKELRTRTQMVLASGDQISKFEITDHALSVTQGSVNYAKYTDQVVEWMQPFLDFLPDMEFAFSGTDSPRVVVPRDELDSLVHYCSKQGSNESEENAYRKLLEFSDLSKQATWEVVTMSCHKDSGSRLMSPPEDKHKSAINFVKNVAKSRDVCQIPEAGSSHGLFIAPENFKWTKMLLPIFSRAVPSAFQDIIMPAPDYTAGHQELNHGMDQDTPWQQRANRFFWTGSPMEGYAHRGKWHQSHRARFVDLMNDGTRKVPFLRQASAGFWRAYDSSISSLSDVLDIDVRFTNDTTGCDEKDCADIRKGLPFREDKSGSETEIEQEARNSRFVFDVDGNTFSPDFYRLLESGSTVFKQTIFREWHDDRLVPWVHYVPISLGMKELPETLRFLSSKDGEGIAKQIAEKGREWKRKVLRREDVVSIWFRILLEWGRLVGDGREGDGICS